VNNYIHDKMEADESEWEDLVNENDAGSEMLAREKVMVSTASQTGDHMSLRSVAKEGTLASYVKPLSIDYPNSSIRVGRSISVP